MLTTTHAPGSAFLTFTRTGSDTVLTRAFATSPVKVIETRGRGSTCWVYAATFGGGLVGGDEIHLRADVATGARALLTTQASTKVYRSSRQSRQSLDVAIAADALLVVVPDPIVCFADANFVQTQRYDLHERSTLVMVDWMTSGRHAAGERWAFSRYESRVDIRRGAQRIFLDGLVLQRELDSVAERMGGVDVLLTAIITGPLVADAAAEIIERVSQDPISRGSDLVSSAAKLRDGGALLRIAGRSVEQVGGELRTSLAFLPLLVGDDLWNRKW
jgi:urease accessory protein